MDQQQLTRRRFIVSVIALSAAAGSTLRPGLFSVSQAWAESASPLDDPVHKAMVRMARLLFPHDALSDDVYAEILDQALSDTASSNENAANLEAAAAALDRQSGDSWQALDEAAQIEAMRSIEAEPYFLAIQNQVRVGIYNGAAFWKHVGYPGPSKGFGGYLHRGAGDIDWLPEDK
ncbi:MAG: hypothetical protein OEQ30_09190 [Gammaproteobacteria bacterium]|jgi:hypothetical protein|nr:hypothetical protein [Gammaproteobacteria bacterium]MDH3758914.1 hypothetical protein [Gammaproteobacteria bacterium]MDH3864930.1 hypothetical protein [Gammaproteobacteria bacterium]MDH3906244.1 hypothetical protein [Gammaproteobacteria bacterium]MDH3954537.1 hypothetical protein [Gammaproteobacteria bacterium]